MSSVKRIIVEGGFSTVELFVRENVDFDCEFNGIDVDSGETITVKMPWNCEIETVSNGSDSKFLLFAERIADYQNELIEMVVNRPMDLNNGNEKFKHIMSALKEINRDLEGMKIS